MIDCIFTLDYEIYGNGTGSLNDVVLEPGEKLREIFQKWDARFVNFVEVAELEQIERHNSDAAIGRVKRQVRELHEKGFEIALHLHPQWCNARYQSGQWMLDLAEYNLCELSAGRIGEIVDRSIDYLRTITGQGDFTPLSFRAGNWLFQPTQRAAYVLSQRESRWILLCSRAECSATTRSTTGPRSRTAITGRSTLTSINRSLPGPGSKCRSTRKWFPSGEW